MTGASWTVIHVQGDGGAPSVDPLQFLSCLGALREATRDVRWHYRWEPSGREHSIDGLRLEIPFKSKSQARIVEYLESRIPPPDGLYAEPMRFDRDLDAVHEPREAEDCLTLLWRYSEFLADVRTRNPHVALREWRGLSRGALLFFVTGDRRHLEEGLDQARLQTVPRVSLGNLVALVRANPIPYRIPPRDRREAVNSARIHHLACCTFASEYYPFTSYGQT